MRKNSLLFLKTTTLGIGNLTSLLILGIAAQHTYNGVHVVPNASSLTRSDIYFVWNWKGTFGLGIQYMQEFKKLLYCLYKRECPNISLGGKCLNWWWNRPSITLYTNNGSNFKTQPTSTLHYTTAEPFSCKIYILGQCIFGMYNCPCICFYKNHGTHWKRIHFILKRENKREKSMDENYGASNWIFFSVKLHDAKIT